jgi:hypothetical protein
MHLSKSRCPDPETVEKNVWLANNGMFMIESLSIQEDESEPLPAPAEPPPQFGKWEKNSASEYLLNKALNYYYDEKSGFYYGGEPPVWTNDPDIPEGAKYKQQGPGAPVANAKDVLCFMVTGQCSAVLYTQGGGGDYSLQRKP